MKLGNLPILVRAGKYPSCHLEANNSFIILLIHTGNGECCTPSIPNLQSLFHFKAKTRNSLTISLRYIAFWNENKIATSRIFCVAYKTINSIYNPCFWNYQYLPNPSKRVSNYGMLDGSSISSHCCSVHEKIQCHQQIFSATIIDLSMHLDTTTLRCTAQRRNIIEIRSMKYRLKYRCLHFLVTGVVI